jgi:hypothetical protein
MRPMSLFVAAAWALGTKFFFLWLLTLTVSLRPGAENDIINAFGCQLVSTLVALFLILRVHAPDASIRELLGVRRTNVGFYPLAIALGISLQAPANALYTWLSRRFPTPNDNSDERLIEIFTDAGTAKRAAIGVVFVALGPMLEEVFFRGALFSPPRKRYDALAVIVATAVLFALAHDPWQMYIPIAMVGISLGLLRSASGSLMPSALMHATFNAIPFYALAMKRPGGENSSDETIPIAMTVISTAVSLGLLYAVHSLGQRAEDAKIAQKKDIS